MPGWLRLAVALVLWATAAAATADGGVRALYGKTPGVDATLARAGPAEWTLTYRFAEKASAWFFVRSFPMLDDRSWRLVSWRVDTPGVVLERIGPYDVLRSVDGTPLTETKITLSPVTGSLKADYTPFLRFTDGGSATYLKHYWLAPLQSAAAAKALPADLNGVTFRIAPERLTVSVPGERLLYRGKPGRDRIVTWPMDDDTYLYIGTARPLVTPSFAGLLDPGLPGWIRTELDTFTPRLFAFYRQAMGVPVGDRPMILAAWGGTEFRGASRGGSVLAGMIVMDIRGDKLVESSPPHLAGLRWFIGHESAHFWMGQTVVYGRRSDAWIIEGAADLMAVRAQAALVPDYDARAELQREVDDCIVRNGPKALSGASERGDVRSNYACGATLLIAVEAAARRQRPGGDIFGWLRALIDANRADGQVTQAEWLAQFRAVTGNAALTGRVRDSLENGSGDPVAFFADLFTATGVAFQREGERLILA